MMEEGQELMVQGISPMQFYIAIVIVPATTIIVVMLGVVLNNVNMNHRISDLQSEFTGLLNARFEQLNESLLRVEGVVDARLTQIERGVI